MLFSRDWLLELCPTDEPLEAIVAALTSRGLTVDSVEDGGTDAVLDVDVPANRPDCLGHLGLARELSAATGLPLAAPRPDPAGGDDVTESVVRVEIEDPELCPRYTARVVRGVKTGPSPGWVVRRLESCGLRSVNNVVDASNLVLLELGQPIHFFDLERIAAPGSGPKLVRVRLARSGEELRTLDGVDRVLDPETLVIADCRRAIAIGGVIGGADSEIGATTKDVLIEAAAFCPRSIRATSRRLGIATDASFRFERGGDPDAPPAAQTLAASLLAELADGRAAPDVVDACPRPATVRRLDLSLAELRRLLGYAPDDETVHAALSALGLSPQADGAGRFRVTVPSYRSDLEREADLVEEVARHVGYDGIPASVTGLPAQIARAPHEAQEREEQARDMLAHQGFHEILSYSMIAAGEDDAFVLEGCPPPLSLTNPIAEPLSVLRRSVLPGLLQAVELNQRRGNRDLRLFEIGRVFLGEADGRFPLEPLRLGIAWCGSGEPAHWSRPDREADLYDLVGALDGVLVGLRPGGSWRHVPGGPRAFHPARSLRWEAADGETLAWGGALHPELQAGFETTVLLVEAELDPLLTGARRAVQHTAVSRLPGVTRDLALVLDADRTYASVLDTLAGVPPPAPVRFRVVDRYAGPPLDPGQTSLTVRVLLRPHERTLTDPETEAYRQALVDALSRSLGVRIRD